MSVEGALGLVLKDIVAIARRTPELTGDERTVAAIAAANLAIFLSQDEIAPSEDNE